MCLYTSAMLLLHLCCACVMYKHVAYGRKNTLYFHIDTHFSCHVRPFNGLFFVERDSDTVEEKQNHRLQVGITGRFLKHGRATVTLQLSNLVGYIHYLWFWIMLNERIPWSLNNIANFGSIYVNGLIKLDQLVYIWLWKCSYICRG